MELSWIKRTRMPNTYVRMLAREFTDLARVTAGTGIAPGELAHYPGPVTVEQHLRCIENVIPLCASPDWHLQWGKRMAENFHGAVTTAWLNAPTLGEGLDAFIHYMPSRVPYLAWQGRAVDGEFRCEVTPIVELGPVRHMLVEVPLIVMHEYVRVMRYGPASAARVELGYRPPMDPGLYARWFDCPVRFGCASNALVIPRAWRDIAHLDFDEHAWREALARCAARHQSTDAQQVVGRVRHLLLESLEQREAGAEPTLQHVARRMHLSPRTVIRRLRTEGTTFQRVCDEVLMERAQTLLADPDNRVQDVAFRLGYTDAASFRKAFRRWFDAAPGEYRARAPRGP